MDTKRLILSVTIMLVIIIGWQLALTQIIKRHPSWAHRARRLQPRHHRPPTPTALLRRQQHPLLPASPQQGCRPWDQPAAVQAVLGNDPAQLCNGDDNRSRRSRP